MCGIAGIVDLRGVAEIDERLLRNMTDALTHRGPDECGYHREPGVGFGHRRLSIIDLASGQQPMASDDRRCWLTYNCEIYNYQELRTELEAAGYSFRTHSDTEVLLKSWLHWQEDCVRRLRGMFAFAVWDAARETLFLARDHLGVKPLYFAGLADGRVLFASELKSLMLCPEVGRDIDPLAVEEYFSYGYVPEPRTIYTSVAKLAPGHSLCLRRGQALQTPRQYWDVPFRLDSKLGMADAAEQLLTRTREAVRSQMVSEVPLGAFLSGGVDSSAVVAMMAGLQSTPVNTCSIGFDVAGFDESSYAAEIAQRFGTTHHTRQVSPDDFALVDKLIDLYDEPYADSSALPTYRVCELARERVTVALSGDGGDENHAGYRRYKLHMAEEKIRSLLPLNVRRAVFGPLGALYPKADWAPRVFRAKTTFQSLARDSVAAYFHTISIFSDDLRAKLFSPAFRRDLQGYTAVEVLRRHAAASPTDDALSLVQYLDLKTYLPGDILTKVDRASMAHALEVRVPLLDHELVEWTSSLPSALKLHHGEGKFLFKKCLEPHLPEHILYRPKMGFAVPLAKWFRGALRERIESVVMGERLRATGYFNESFLRHLTEAHHSGRRDYSALLWTLMMFDAFLGKAGVR
ncbi:MAG: amidotransferase 1, exosortase A system-associated [Gammaproteobacteria bacterium]|nr:amidotransferase 1, exosortase A system-associated [Gammaproteobacteria bacterium]